jgi:electron transport complex protein RnfG
MYGYDPDTETLTGMTVLASKETPGLGSRIGEPDFRRSLVDLDLGLSAEDQGLEHPVIAAKPGEAGDPWAFEAITGATISSNAVAAAITQSAEEALPKIQAHLDQIKRKGE